MENLFEVHFRKSVSPHEPWGMCVTSGLLLFGDSSKTIKRINPMSSGVYNYITTNDTRSWRIQYVNFEEKKLLLIAYGRPLATQGGVHTYNVKTKQLEWRVEGRLPGMRKVIKAEGLTVDDHGYIFVCDVNNKCIQMFHVSDGRYLGAVMKEGEQGLGIPFRNRWCSRMSSLVVIHNKSARWFITVFKVEREN